MKFDICRTIWVIVAFAVVFYIGICWFARPLKQYVEGFEGYLMDTKPVPVIPLDIYQTWHSKDLPPKIKYCVETLKTQNPEFKHHLYDEKECYQFINDNFDPEVAEAYDALIPKAYKADLWRYCILYKRGGVYLDIKFQSVGDFKLIELTDREYFVRDIQSSEGGILNGYIVSLPGNPIIKRGIDRIVENVRTRYYGSGCLYPTGPMLLKSVMSQSESDEVDRLGLTTVVQSTPRSIYIHRYNKAILKTYDEYYEKDNAKGTFFELWTQRKIYK